MPLYDNVSDLTLKDRRSSIVLTELAFERTMLAYLRTGLTLAIGGVTIGKFFPEISYQVAAWVFMLSGISMMAYTALRYHQANRAKKTRD